MLAYLIGFAAGIIGGMGIGGGTILIPSLIFFLGTSQQIAQSVNLLSFIPAAIVAIIIHLKNKNIEVKIILRLVLLGSLGAIAGSLIAVSINPIFLKKLFGIFLLIMGFKELVSKPCTK